MSDTPVKNTQEKQNRSLLYHFLAIKFFSFPGDKNDGRFLGI